jgi:hypothetical protein
MLAVETPSPRAGLVAALTVNAVVAATSWYAVAHRHGSSWVGYHFGPWLRPVVFFLAGTRIPGIAALFVTGWRHLGAAVIAGSIVAGLLDAVWAFGYLVSQGS